MRSNPPLPSSPSRHITSTLFARAAFWIPILIALAYYIDVALRPEHAGWWVAREKGVFEHATPLILLPGVLFGAAAFLTLPKPGLPRFRWWILGWTAASLFFAGEEASWGQHYFGWKTPESFAAINEQRETNLHNTADWLNKVPRHIVELWILIAGIIMPLRMRKATPGSKPSLPEWLWAFPWAIPVAAINFLSRLLDHLGGYFPDASRVHLILNNMGDAEAREFFIAFFLLLYLHGFLLRARRLKTARGLQR